MTYLSSEGKKSSLTLPRFAEQGGLSELRLSLFAQLAEKGSVMSTRWTVT
ncbi:hypothetical protein BN1183_AQ_00380 [Pantoea ananatis]|nr:hypothetical protein BN1183_AQ_00380 [Pantoea ananatis]